MRISPKLAYATAFALLIGCGDCGGEEPTPTDAGADAAMSDMGNDAAIEDMTVDGGNGDMTAADAEVDGGDAGPACGNGQLDGEEVCDGTVFRDDPSCDSLGLPDGEITCTDSCELDTSGCAVCDDGVCSDGETATSCAADCGVTSISAGRTHTCATLADGSLWCWGAREGHGMGGTPDTLVPVRVLGHDDVTSVSAGEHHTCFVKSNDTVWCFGKNGFGEAGPAQSYHVYPPVQVTAGTQVATGQHHSCAVDSTDNIVCWGRGDHGQRGDGGFSMRQALPETASTNGASSDLVLGGHVSCAASSARVRCWGDNSRGQLVTGNTEWQTTPTTVLDLYQFILSGAAVGETHACFNVQSRYDSDLYAVYCFGGNAYGQLGKEASTDLLTDENPLLREMSPIVAGFGYTCGHDISDPATPDVVCWGDNYFGQLGDGTTTANHEPQSVAGVGEVLDLSGGHDHVCAILPDQTARCWGRNREGQLGIGKTSRSEEIPVAPLRMGPAGEDQ